MAGIINPLIDNNVALTTSMDLNDITEHGLWCTAQAAISNFPSDATVEFGSLLIVAGYPGSNGDRISQVLINSNGIYKRGKLGEADWTDWVKI